jgi:hypothetical protein
LKPFSSSEWKSVGVAVPDEFVRLGERMSDADLAEHFQQSPLRRQHVRRPVAPLEGAGLEERSRSFEGLEAGERAMIPARRATATRANFLRSSMNSPRGKAP